MLQHSKIVKSRKEWKDKAAMRGDENRQHRKAKKLDLETIAKLKTKIRQLKQAVEAKKNH
jgi:hypothetical protein